jgi:hypothetical protein
MRKAPPSRRRLALLAVPLALAAAAELGVRLFVPMDALVYRDSEDPSLRFELRPGASGLKDGVPVSINSAGLRGPELAPKPAGALRAAVAGGHEGFGLGVELAQSMAARLAPLLAQDRKVPADTVNLSMYSWTLGQKVRQACARLAAVDADLVLLQVSDDDARELPRGAVSAPRLKNALRESSAALRLVDERRYWKRAAREQALAEAAAPAPAPAAPAGEREAALAAEQLAAFKRCLDEAGAAGAVLLVPNLAVPPGRETPETAAFRRALERSSRGLGLPFRDAGPALRALPAGAALKRPGEPVLSPEGQRVLSEEARRLLRPVKPPPRRKPGRPSV